MKTKLCLGMVLLAAALAPAQTNSLTSLLQQGLMEEQANRNLDAAITDYQKLATKFDQDRQLAATAVFRLGECYRAQGRTNEAAAQYQRILREFADQPTLATLSRQNLAGMGIAQAGTAAGSQTENPDAALLKKLDGMPKDDLEKVLPTVMPDSALSDLLQKRDAVQVERNQLLVDWGTNSLQVTRKDALLAELNRQINEKISGMLHGLKLRSELTLSSPVAGDARQQQKDLLAKQIALAEQDWDDTQKKVRTGQATQADTRASEREVLRLKQQLAALDNVRVDLMNLQVPAGSEEDQEIARIKEMIKNSPDLINGNPTQGSPLCRAAEAGKMHVAEFLLDNGADVNAPGDAAGKTPLLAAAEAGQKAMVELLLKRGADINAAGEQGGSTALHLAVDQGFTGVAQVLLDAKADPNLRDKGTQTPLFIAAKKGSRSMAAMLLAHGADPNLARKLPPNYGWNPIEQGRKMYGTPLHIAVVRGDKEMVALLLTNRADVKALSLYDETPLQVAAACGKADVAELLLAAGADPDARNDADSLTSLHLAAEDGSRDVVERLLTHGANPNVTAVAGRRGVTPLMLAANYGHDDTALLLLQHKADPNLKDETGDTALVRAVEAKRAAVVKTLLAHGADPEAKGGEWPALMMAAGRNSPEMTSALIEAKADVNVVAGGERHTALHDAAYNGNVEIVKLLLAAHANVNARDYYGNTPLVLAVRGGKDEVVSLLLAAKADPNIRNDSGRTALDIAKGAERSSPLGMPGGALTLGTQGGIPGGNGVVLNSTGMPGRNGVVLNSTGPASKPAESPVAAVLRQHGALDVLPDWDRIRVSRPSANFTDIVFTRGTNHWNQYSLLELLYAYNSPHNPNFAFPDLSRIVIVRPSADGATSKRIPVNLLDATNSLDVTRDVPLEFGDEVEIPEREHSLKEAADFENKGRNRGGVYAILSAGDWDKLYQHIGKEAGEVKLVVAGGSTVPLHLRYSFQRMSDLLDNDEAKSALTSSSDLSRVKVSRRNVRTGKPEEWTVNCDDRSNPPDFCLRAGDVIEVPVKP